MKVWRAGPPVACTILSSAAPAFAVFKGWAARLLALQRFVVYPSSPPPDGARSLALAHVRREHATENCSRPLIGFEHQFRRFTGFAMNIFQLLDFLPLATDYKVVEAALPNVSHIEASCHRRLWPVRSLRRNSDNTRCEKRCFSTCITVEGVPRSGSLIGR